MDFPSSNANFACSSAYSPPGMVKGLSLIAKILTLDFAFDMMTHVGELDGIHYSLGYAGHGVAMGTHLGKTVAEAMLKGNIKNHPFAKFDFPNAPLGLYDGRPWFLPFAGMWHKFLDWVE